jgi:hypothetical protein
MRLPSICGLILRVKYFSLYLLLLLLASNQYTVSAKFFKPKHAKARDLGFRAMLKHTSADWQRAYLFDKFVKGR